MNDNEEFRTHDNIDRDVIKINKSTLLLLLGRCAAHASAASGIATYGGISLTLLTAAFLTEGFRSLWTIPGTTIQAAFLVGGIATAAMTGYKIFQWSKEKGAHTPEAVVQSLERKNRDAPLLLPTTAQVQSIEVKKPKPIVKRSEKSTPTQTS